MKPNNIETCRRLLNELRWSERHAEQNARIAVSKAMWLGLDKQEVLQLIGTIPSAGYLRKHPEVFPSAWESVTQAASPDQPLTEYERLMNAAN